jgi:arylsulfatase B
MSRIIFIIAITVASIAAITYIYLLPSVVSQKKPNIVLIVADDLGWADVGYHDTRVKTPNLDNLAKEGIELDRFYVAPTCSATRAGLMTGRYPIRFGMGRSALSPNRRYGLPESEITIPEALSAEGYVQRGIFGKWHLGHLEPQWHPLAHGFTQFEGHYNGAINYFSHKFKGERDWHINYEPALKKGYSTDLIVTSAQEFIRDSSKEAAPYFAFISFNAPHTPYQAKKEDIEKFATPGEPSTDETIQAAMIWSLDNAVGRILEEIENSGEADNTIVWFMSDNGGDKGIDGNNAPLSGHKRGVFEGGIRVPSIVKWPQKWVGGRKISDRIGYIDVLPTLVAQSQTVNRANTELSNIDGINLGPLFQDTNFKIQDRDWYTYIAQDHPVLEWQSIHSGEWKMIVYGPRLDFERLGRKHGVEIYDIEADPSEQINLVTSQRSRILLLADKLAKHRSLQPENAIPWYGAGSEISFTPPKNWRNAPRGN